MDPEILPGSGTRKIQSLIRIRNKLFRIRNTGYICLFLWNKLTKVFFLPFLLNCLLTVQIQKCWVCQNLLQYRGTSGCANNRLHCIIGWGQKQTSAHQGIWQNNITVLQGVQKRHLSYLQHVRLQFTSHSLNNFEHYISVFAFAIKTSFAKTENIVFFEHRRRCGGSIVAYQTSGFESGISECGAAGSLCNTVCTENLRAERKPTPEAKKEN